MENILDHGAYEEGTIEYTMRKVVRNNLSRLESVQFPVPVQDKEKIGLLDSLQKEALDQDFIKQIGHLKRKISKFLKPKKLKNKTLDGISFLLIVEEYLNIYNKGETLTISGIIQRTETEERKFLMNHIQDWVDYYFESNFLKKDLVEVGVVKLIEMAGEDQPDYRFEVFKKALEYFVEELRFKEEKEKTVRIKFLSKSIENIKSAFPEYMGIKMIQKILEDQSLKDKLFEFEEIYDTIMETALLEEKDKCKKQIDFLKEKMQIQDSNYLYLKEQCEQLEKENIQWKTQFTKLDDEYQKLRIKLNAQKEELSNLREINSGKRNSSVQLGILIEANTELKEENSILKNKLKDVKMIRKNKNLNQFLRNLGSSKDENSMRGVIQHIQETLLKENEFLRNQILELEESKKQMQGNIRKMSLQPQTLAYR